MVEATTPLPRLSHHEPLRQTQVRLEALVLSEATEAEVLMAEEATHLEGTTAVVSVAEDNAIQVSEFPKDE